MEKHFQAKSIELTITLSIGFASYPRDAKDIESLLHHADLAMYKHKEQQKRIKLESNTA